MKRFVTVVIVALALFAAMPIFAGTPNVAEDVIRLWQAKVGDDAIIAFVQGKRGEFAINADDIIAMSQARVSKAVIKAVIDEAAVPREAEPIEALAAPPLRYPYSYSYPYTYGPTLHGFFGFGRTYGLYGHYGRYGGFGHHRGWRH